MYSILFIIKCLFNFRTNENGLWREHWIWFITAIARLKTRDVALIEQNSSKLLQICCQIEFVKKFYFVCLFFSSFQVLDNDSMMDGGEFWSSANEGGHENDKRRRLTCSLVSCLSEDISRPFRITSSHIQSSGDDINTRSGAVPCLPIAHPVPVASTAYLESNRWVPRK